jgi:DNA-binding NarL/FixJ family response regulator
LLSVPEYEIVGEAQDGIEAVRAVERLEPDLILMDLSMPRMNGFEAIREVKSRFPEIKILVLTVHKTEEHVLEAFQAGADGYLLKYAAKDELFLALKSVFEGRSFLSPLISDKVIDGFVEGARSIKETSAWDTLTSRERQVLKLIAEGYANKEIAEHLFISVKTVETHRSNIMKKLDLHNASEITAYAMKRGLLS